MPDYTQGKIYEIVCITTGYCYIGSTIQTLRRRLQNHEKSYRRFLSGKCKTNNSSYGTLMNNNYIIKLIENYPCQTKKELTRREGFFQKTRCCINKEIAGRTDREYYYDNWDKLKEYRTQYEKDNSERISLRKKEYYLTIKDKRAQKYQNNKETIIQKQAERITCECGDDIARGKKARHCKTKRHQTLMDPEKKEEFLRKEQIREANRITCECGRRVGKRDISGHRKSKIHKKLMSIE